MEIKVSSEGRLNIFSIFLKAVLEPQSKLEPENDPIIFER